MQVPAGEQWTHPGAGSTPSTAPVTFGGMVGRVDVVDLDESQNGSLPTPILTGADQLQVAATMAMEDSEEGTKQEETADSLETVKSAEEVPKH